MDEWTNDDDIQFYPPEYEREKLIRDVLAIPWPEENDEEDFFIPITQEHITKNEEE